jgi:hypothetical protein
MRRAATATSTGLLALLLVACGVATGSGAQTSTPTAASEPSVVKGRLSGSVTGLGEGDEATLVVAPYDAQADPHDGAPVLEIDLGNGEWEIGIDGRLGPGTYVVGASAEGYVSLPGQVRFTVSEPGVTYQFGGLDFGLVKPEEAEERLGMPLCSEEPTIEPSATSTPTPTFGAPDPLAPGELGNVCMSAGGTSFVLESGMTGTVSGLPEGAIASVWIDRLPDREGECYAITGPPIDCTQPVALTGPVYPMPYPVPGCCMPNVPPDGEVQYDPLTTRSRIASFNVTNGRWGLVDPSLAGHRYAVGFTVDAPHEPMGGYYVVVYSSKLPSVVDGVDFTFVPHIDEGTPTATPTAVPGVTPTPTATVAPMHTEVP